MEDARVFIKKAVTRLGMPSLFPFLFFFLLFVFYLYSHVSMLCHSVLALRQSDRSSVSIQHYCIIMTIITFTHR